MDAIDRDKGFPGRPWNTPPKVETLVESCTPVLRLFGREPTVEDLRCVGRWSYAAAWLSEERSAARELVQARLSLATGAATTAAMAAGRGDAERFALVSAVARLSEAIEGGGGTLAAAADRAFDEAAGQLAQDGATLRAATFRERAAFAPRFGLEGFASAILDTGQDRHVMMREASATLEEALLGVRGPCPALRVLRLFLLATLAVESHDASATLAPAPSEERDPVATLGIWLTADLALAARRATAYETAWATAARTSGDAISKTIAGLTSGAMLSKGVVEAFVDDPWALPLTLAMTTEPQHASALLDCGVRAQAAQRAQAGKEVARWATQSMRVDDLEGSLGIDIVASRETREGHREHETCGGLDLFSAWSVVRGAEEARSILRESVNRSVGVETSKRREAVRRAKNALQGLREAYEAAIEAARAKAEVPLENAAELARTEAGAQRGCLFGFGAGCSVMAIYAAVGLVVGMGGVVGRVAPLVVGIAALPVVAAVAVQLAASLKKAAAAAERNRRKAAAAAEMERLRSIAERTHGGPMAQAREALEAAEASLVTLERRISAAGPATN